MLKDGGLRGIFRSQFPHYQWSTIEVGAIAGGIPDNEFCTPTGVSGWFEFKFTKIYHTQIRPLQVAWLMKRCRYGGNAWIGVRRIPQSIQEEGVDQLWIMKGDQAEKLFYDGLRGTTSKHWDGGPSRWNWNEIEQTFLACNPG